MAGGIFDTRNLHRDLGYFFVGLIISFAISGILQNHRRSLDPERYVYSTIDVQTDWNTIDKASINEDKVSAELAKNKIDGKVRAVRKENDGKSVKGLFENGVIEVSLEDGKGRIDFLKTRPVLGQMAILHKSTNSVWIWYSDIFAIGMLTIAITGMLMFKGGQYSFKQRGYKLALAGIVFPLVMLFFFL